MFKVPSASTLIEESVAPANTILSIVREENSDIVKCRPGQSIMHSELIL
jgi:hypothetical protein